MHIAGHLRPLTMAFVLPFGVSRNVVDIDRADTLNGPAQQCAALLMLSGVSVKGIFRTLYFSPAHLPARIDDVDIRYSVRRITRDIACIGSFRQRD